MIVTNGLTRLNIMAKHDRGECSKIHVIRLPEGDKSAAQSSQITLNRSFFQIFGCAKHPSLTADDTPASTDSR